MRLTGEQKRKQKKLRRALQEKEKTYVAAFNSALEIRLKLDRAGLYKEKLEGVLNEDGATVGDYTVGYRYWNEVTVDEDGNETEELKSEKCSIDGQPCTAEGEVIKKMRLA